MKFTEKENEVISHLAGYVVGTFYRRIRFSKNYGLLYQQQALSFLLICKFVDGTETDTSHQKFTNLKNRGGLWVVRKDVVTIFSIAESFFVSATKNFVNKIDASLIVSSLMENAYLIACFNFVRKKSDITIKKEIGLNLLEDMLTLYIRVRAHSYAKDKQEEHKMAKNRTKARSLRTEIKRQSSSLDTGH